RQPGNFFHSWNRTMKRLAYKLAHLGLAIAAISLIDLWSGVPVEAQTKGRETSAQPAPRARSAGEGQERLNYDKDWSKDASEMKQYQEVRKGSSPSNRSELLDHAAQWYAYRLTHTEHQDSRPAF